MIGFEEVGDGGTFGDLDEKERVENDQTEVARGI